MRTFFKNGRCHTAHEIEETAMTTPGMQKMSTDDEPCSLLVHDTQPVTLKVTVFPNIKTMVLSNSLNM